MADSYDDAQTLGRYVHELVRRRALRALSEHDAALSKSYRRIAEGIRRDLRAAGFTIEQVQAILEKHFGESFEERLRILEVAITDAAKEARTLDRETFEAIFGAEAARAPGPFAQRSAPPTLRSLTPPQESEDEPPSMD